jgi:hypothetical protein
VRPDVSGGTVRRLRTTLASARHTHRLLVDAA